MASHLLPYWSRLEKGVMKCAPIFPLALFIREKVFSVCMNLCKTESGVYVLYVLSFSFFMQKFLNGLTKIGRNIFPVHVHNSATCMQDMMDK